MKIGYRRHAIVRMLGRGISPREVEEAIVEAKERYYDVVHGVTVCVRRKDDRALIIAYVVAGEDVSVVTVYSPSKVDKVVERKVNSGRWRVWSR